MWVFLYLCWTKQQFNQPSFIPAMCTSVFAVIFKHEWVFSLGAAVFTAIPGTIIRELFMKTKRRPTAAKQ